MNLFHFHELIKVIGDGCMAGYGYERMKLKEYLGIEWIENGFDETGERDDKPIRHANDLDCTFDDIKKCQWRNVKENEALDSLDFHLFEKIDFTEFPVLQVRPGPSRLARGDKLLFTGDRKPEEQTAILKSSPIRCQNNTGILTFTFWLYNGARVEVLLLKEKEGRLVILPEKPFVDCGTVLINTECTAEISPLDEEFSIGIKAYNMGNREGSFVMVDNIVYRASLFDLGENFRGRPFITSHKENLVRAAHELNCSNFSSKCRWRTVGHALEVNTDESPSSELMFNATGALLVPVAPFLFMYIEQNRHGPFNVLQSDPIDCQTENISKFNFRFWTTRNVTLEICARNRSLNAVECHLAPMALSPALVSIKFNKLSTFTLTIEVKSVNSDYDNFIAIDDISYEATFCSEAVNAWDLGGSFYPTPMLSALIFLHCQLTWDFPRAVDCMWANHEQTEPVWQIGTTPLDKHKFISLTGSSEFPDGEFAVVRLKSGQASTLITEPIRCIISQATLTFRSLFWLSGSTRLDVCLLEDKVSEAVDCQKIVLKQPGPALVDLPGINHPVRIALKAESSSQGMALIDDLVVTGDICPSVIRHHGVRLFGSGLAQIPDPNVCRLLSCNFKEGQTCLYSSGRVALSQSNFKARNGAVTAFLFKKGKVAVLESPTFRLNAAARIHFLYQNEANASSVFVCHDSISRELESCFKVGGDSEGLLPSDTKFYMVAKLVDNSRSACVSITNITVTDVDNNLACSL
uniref:MAM domain-containing protein n=1 Tax=Elaeophora elaphi TaxID=1147741 RepID=A0A0R3RYB0_9BILA